MFKDNWSQSSCFACQISFLINVSSFSSSLLISGFPKMEVCQEYYGLPPPPVGFGQPLHLSKGHIIELTRAGPDLPWWEVALKTKYKHITLYYSEGWGGGCHTLFFYVFKPCFLWLMCRCELFASFSVSFVIFLSVSRFSPSLVPGQHT